MLSLRNGCEDENWGMIEQTVEMWGMFLFYFIFFFLHNSIMELACALRGASVRLQMHEMLTSTRWNIWIVNTIQAHVGCWWWNMFICTVRTINQPYDGWDWENLSRWRRISLSVSTCFFHLDLSSSYRISKLFFFSFLFAVDTRWKKWWRCWMHTKSFVYFYGRNLSKDVFILIRVLE